MKIIAFIEEEAVIGQILEHLRLREDPEPRPPPAVPGQVDIQCVPFFDFFPRREKRQDSSAPAVAVNRP